MTDTNIDQHFDFNYACEEAKIEFQSTVSSLLELQAMLSARGASATERGKDGVYFSIGELEVYKDWLLDSSCALMEHYGHIDRTNRLLNKRFQLVQFASKRKAA